MKLTTLLSTAAVTSITSAQTVKYSAGNDISYQVSVPAATAQSGNGDFFFQMTGPTTNQWISMGVGSSQMRGAQMFIMYEDGTGNVTVSPRLGVGNVMPLLNPYATLELLEGSGVSGSMMTANVRCMNCSTWGTDSKIDYTSTSETWIWANRQGNALDSTSTSATLQQHQNNGQAFSLNMVTATGGSATANPFATTAGAAVPASSSGSAGSSSGSANMDAGPSNNIIIAHGVIMGLTVVILLPFGALAMRLTPVPWWLHGAVQTFFLLLITAGFGLGYYYADNTAQLYTGDGYTHTVLGTTLFAFFWIQPFLGYAHHLMYKRKGQRTIVSHAHIWWGRIVMTLAIINGGLGLALADNTTGGEIAYGVVAGIVFVVYVAGALFGEFKRKDISHKHGEEK